MTGLGVSKEGHRRKFAMMVKKLENIEEWTKKAQDLGNREITGNYPFLKLFNQFSS